VPEAKRPTDRLWSQGLARGIGGSMPSPGSLPPSFGLKAQVQNQVQYRYRLSTGTEQVQSLKVKLKT